MRNDQTETKWTPEPWQVTQCRNGMPYVNVFRVSGPSDGTAPCTILFETKYETAAENKANARAGYVQGSRSSFARLSRPHRCAFCSSAKGRCRACGRDACQ